ncbi:MAG: HEAT repeat domain-containing protein [Firmicutes bacterium]|nr:HEAT repeat domain-containing protein [Bacillota bacterium]
MPKLKKEVKNCLLKGDFQTILRLGKNNRGHVTGALLASLYSTDDLLRWRAVESLGLLVDQLSRQDPDRAREIVRNLFWALNDESGGSGWASPEAVGEIIRHRPELFSDFISIMVSFQDDPSLIRGIVWSLGRIGEKNPELVSDYNPLLLELLDSPDPQLRGLALWSLLKIKAVIPAPRLQALQKDPGSFTVYENGNLHTLPIAKLPD